MSEARSRTFVLVHGAWHGGWCWRRVADRLTAAGHRVFTPTLTGLGERQHLLSASITLDTHVQDVCNLIRFEELTDICLVGHSYAGMVISRVAEEMEARMQLQHALANAEPAEPVEALAPFKRFAQKVGRNDPCPCGSGKKYKQCHGKLA